MNTDRDLHCFYEYDEIKNSNVLSAVKSNKALQEFFTPTFDALKAKQYCGILNIEGDDFFILPKIAADEQHNLDTFIYMLMVAYDIEIKTDDKFKYIFSALEEKSLTPKQGVFFDGQVFDAYLFLSDLIKKATASIVILDNYIDETVLTHLNKANNNVTITILTKNITKQLKLDIDKYNAQYSNIELKKFTSSHDRFIIIDEKEIYHIGASLKDLGKKWFAFSKLEEESFGLMDRVKEVTGDE